jgi:probable phosphoglycerate mutase
MTANGAHNPNEAGFVTDAEPKILVVSHGAYLSSLLPLLLTPSKTWTITAAPDVDLKAHCQNTSIMRVRLRPPVRKGTAGEMNGASGSSGRDKGNKWVGVVESWGDVEHLAGLWEKDLDVADDVR